MAGSAQPIERKVKAATGGASVGTAVGALLAWALNRYVFPATMDPVVSAEIVAAIPTVIGGVSAFVSGWWARHTPRPVPPAPPVTPSNVTPVMPEPPGNA